MARIATEEASMEHVFEHIAVTTFYHVKATDETRSHFVECDACGTVWDAVLRTTEPDEDAAMKAGLEGDGWKLGEKDYCPDCAGCVI
jgi:hypothetical protein